MDRMPCFELGDVGSIPAGPANAPMDKVVKSTLSKGVALSVRIGVGVPR